MAKTDGILKLSAPIGADVLNVTDCISGNMRLIDAYATKLDGDIGNKDTLTTTNKTVVGAINEVNVFKSTVLDTLEEVAANTQVHKPAGALALKQANINLTNELVAKETKIANLQAQVARLNTDLSNTNASLSGISNRPYVLEHGTNVNGSYEKWSDGTLTMHGSGESNDASICTITYPIHFRDSAYSLIATPQYNLTTVVFALSVQKKDNTSSYVYTRQMNGAALSHVFISWQASGYWR